MRSRVIGDVAIVLGEPGVDGLSEVVGVLRERQYDGAPMQLHPGDLGWFWRFGAEATAAAVALQELGSSSVIVCTPSSNVGAVATYKSAGFQQLPEIWDHYRDA